MITYLTLNMMGWLAQLFVPATIASNPIFIADFFGNLGDGLSALFRIFIKTISDTFAGISGWF